MSSHSSRRRPRIYEWSQRYTNAQILTLVSVPLTHLLAPPSGYWNKVISATMTAHVVAKYTGIDAGGASIILQYPSTAYAVLGPSDYPYTTVPLVNFTTFLGTDNSDITVPLSGYREARESPGGDGDWGFIQPTLYGTTQVDGIAVELAILNNSVDLGGGDAANYLTVTTQWIEEQV